MESVSSFVPRYEGLKCVRWVEPCVQPYIDRVLPYSLISKCVEYFNFNSAHSCGAHFACPKADTFNECSDTTQYLTGIFSTFSHFEGLIFNRYCCMLSNKSKVCISSH